MLPSFNSNIIDEKTRASSARQSANARPPPKSISEMVTRALLDLHSALCNGDDGGNELVVVTCASA